MSESVTTGGLQSKLHALRDEMVVLDEAQAAAYFELKNHDRLFKSTISLCPLCLDHVPALVYSRSGKVYLQKKCPAHGISKALAENDENYYRLSNKDRWGRRYANAEVMTFPLYQDAPDGQCGDSCGARSNFADQMGNKSCTILVEITNACNLACAVCYSDARGNRKLPLANFKAYIQKLIEQKTALDSVQLTGGEAILHPEFWEMVSFLHASPQVKKIYLPTNGIEFANPEVSEKLLPFANKVMVLLQFDGAEARTNQALRQANPVRCREQAIENLGRLGIHLQLTMTITLGVNDHEIGWVIQTGMKHNHIKVIALQPVTYSGRYDLAHQAMERMTLSDVVKSVAAQISRHAKERDFLPIPCSHPNCGWITLFARRFGMQFNIARHIDLNRAMSQTANRTLLSTGELRSVIGTEQSTLFTRAGEWLGKQFVRSTDVFAVAIKPFMDKYNYDQDRISACCHHLLDTNGQPVSFCEYNARLRPGDPWDRFPLLKQTKA